MYRFFLLVLLQTLLLPLLAQDFYYKQNKKVFLTPIQDDTTLLQRSAETQGLKYYKTPNNVIVGVSDEILLHTREIDAVAQAYGLTLIQELATNLYLVRFGDKNTTLQQANKLHEDARVKFAHPNFYKQVQRR
ncbi:MAG: hypothetical protein RBR54_07615 [Sulfurimonas sp.]|jgi:hypothetical protein|nr:hypothetical protein [Sulfurimonas sp.]